MVILINVRQRSVEEWRVEEKEYEGKYAQGQQFICELQSFITNKKFHDIPHGAGCAQPPKLDKYNRLQCTWYAKPHEFDIYGPLC
jgi:uncharacterized protein YfbU (UPF0304 family)